MNDSESCFHIHAHFSGRVQGVGFRYSTLQIAKGYEVTGFVKNLVDGRVELWAEGSESECRLFLQATQDELDTYIQAVDAREGWGKKAHASFAIA